MIIRLMELLTLIVLIGIIAWINPGSALVAALVILPYLGLMWLLHWQCIRLIRRMVSAYHDPLAHPKIESPPHPNFKSLTGLNL